jgi:hypothetical protein
VLTLPNYVRLHCQTTCVNFTKLRVFTLPNYVCLHYQITCVYITKLRVITCHTQIKTKEADILAQSSAGTKCQFRADRRLSAVSPGDSAASHHNLFPSNAFAPHRHTIQATCHTIRYNLPGSNGSFHKANINNSH